MSELKAVLLYERDVAEVWDTLKAVAEDLDNDNNKLFLQAVGIKVINNDLRSTYDERGDPLQTAPLQLAISCNHKLPGETSKHCQSGYQ